MSPRPNVHEPPAATLVRVREGLDRNELTDRIFSGDLVAFEGLPSAARIVALARDVLAREFAPLDCMTAHENLDPAALKSRLLAARRRFASDPEVAARYAAMLIEAGCDPRETYRDRFVLRGVPPVRALDADTRVVLPAHRDTWGSGFPAQINWWMPVHPLVDGRTMVIYPDAFRAKVANDSEGWDWRRARQPGYPALPTAPASMLAGLSARPVLLEPGTLLALSGAHLHATQVNRTPLPRFSTDTRTVDRRDLLAGRGAPDVDHGRVPFACEWFRRLGDGSPLAINDLGA
ncbi:MAG: hypothetical protein GC150_02920 [Rhizobiales bacterium]|nr:hypothetical protein [Hyphomicrobiales bacterium]